MRSFSNILCISIICVQSIVCIEYTLVSLANLDPTISLELRYASINNFVHENLYGHADAFLIKEAAQALIHVQKELRKEGLSLKIWDAYRPYRSNGNFGVKCQILVMSVIHEKAAGIHEGLPLM